MIRVISSLGARLRVHFARLAARLGLGEDSFLLVLAVLIGIVTAGAAVGFHVLLHEVRDLLYVQLGPAVDIYGRGLAALVLLPAMGGLAVALLGRYVFRIREAHGVVDVIESVVRSKGVIRPLTAVEKIFTSGLTIGSGGSAGAEGPIVQIGAGIASGVGQLFRMARQHLPVLIGCGSAAGISAIFNAPIGAVFFTLEVILYDFSIRTFTPVVLASVIANVTTKEIFAAMGSADYPAIFAISYHKIESHLSLGWEQLHYFVILGVVCGVVGVTFTRFMHFTENRMGALRLPRILKPAIGAGAVGVLGILYVLVFGRLLLNQPKPIEFAAYPLPAFFSDGYGVIKQLVSFEKGGGFYALHPAGHLLLLLGFLCGIKIVATCLTLGSGGSGGIIAPSLFIGASTGGVVGLLLRQAGADAQPDLYALVGMGAVLAAVVHAPLAAILIVFELTQDHKIIAPAMLAAILAAALARVLFRDSIYTLALRRRGVQVGSTAELSLLRRMHIEQVGLEPVASLSSTDPFQRILDLSEDAAAPTAFVVIDQDGLYHGMVLPEDIQAALLQRQAMPLLTVEDVMRRDVTTLRTTDDLAMALDRFSRHDVGHLPVCLPTDPRRVVGIVSRAGLMRSYQQAMART